ncbi:hypothetical protein D1007_39670 [Hordeum vulgare]|nr:hypothetical protein D1007_39670 [Hordeum vulgare]
MGARRGSSQSPMPIVVTTATEADSRSRGRTTCPLTCGRCGGIPLLLPRAGIHAGEEVHEFNVLTPPRSHRSLLQLPDPYARAMEGSQPRVLWLRTDGCCNGPVWAAVNLTPKKPCS